MTMHHIPRLFPLALAGFIAIALLGVLASTPAPTQAAEFRSGSNPSVPRGERIDDDLFIAGGTISIDGEVTRDLIVTGGTVDIAGTIGGNVNVAGGTVTINGPVGGSVRVAAGDVTIRGPIGWDVLVAGGTVTLSQDSRITHDVWSGAGSVTIDGTVGRDVRGNIGSLDLNGTVNGKVRVEVNDQLRIGSGARVNGNVEYASDNQAQIDPGASIGGQTTQRAPGSVQGGTFEFEGIGWLTGFILRLAWALFAGTVLVLLFPRHTAAVTSTLRAAPLISFGWGVVMFFLIPVIAVVLAITVVGIPIALILATLYVVALYLSQIIVGIALVQLVMRLVMPTSRLGADRIRLWVAMLIGVFVVVLIRLLPIPFGWTIWTSMLIGIFALGAIWTTLTRWGHPREPQPQAVSVPIESAPEPA